MASRISLHKTFEDILGSKNVYFQPPTSVLMKYDAIKYSLKDVYTSHADNSTYNQTNCYEVTVIYRDPDADITKKLLALPMCSFDRHYAADGLNHDVLTIYY